MRPLEDTKRRSTFSMRSKKKFATLSAAAAMGVAALATPAANAAPVSAWDQVAACESGGNWQVNTGNG